jgi:epoxyqueuosine reductase QueG
MPQVKSTRKPHPLEWLQREIAVAMKSWKEEWGGDDYWREPLVSVASADDPLFGKLKEVVDPQHAMPQDLLSEAKSVIVFFLPFQRWVGKENAKAEIFAAHSWAECYVTTNKLIASVNDRLRERLEQMGREASVTPATHNFDEEKLVSRWSHKHLAYIAGLGTFGHNSLLITEAGCCGRLGSLVTDMALPPTERPGKEHCLTKAGKRCLACVKKCKYGALHETHFDRHACYKQCKRNDAHHSDLPLVDVCGKCGCGLPCSHRIPVSDSHPPNRRTDPTGQGSEV